MRNVSKVPKLPIRERAAHKGDFGRVLMVAGARGMVGAAALAGDAALRAGAGLVTVATPEGAYPMLAAKLTCCTTCPLPETSIGTLSHSALQEILALAESFDVVAVGPGLGRHRETARLVCSLVGKLDKPLIVDADGLNSLADELAVLKRAPAPRTLTPHPGEMARLLGNVSPAAVQKNRARTAASFAANHGVVLVLKGHGAIVTDGDRIFTNTTGNPGMATGGAGDVLTGVIAAIAAQGMDPFAAAVLGVHVHGIAGDLVAAELGEVSLIASDLLAALPHAFERCRSA